MIGRAGMRGYPRESQKNFICMCNSVDTVLVLSTQAQDPR